MTDDDMKAAREMTEEQIKHMVNRFLGWTFLGEDFRPDGGVSVARPNYDPRVKWTLSGTNLFDAAQADAMVRYLIEGLPRRTPPSDDPHQDNDATRSGADVREVLEQAIINGMRAHAAYPHTEYGSRPLSQFMTDAILASPELDVRRR